MGGVGCRYTYLSRVLLGDFLFCLFLSFWDFGRGEKTGERV